MQRLVEVLHCQFGDQTTRCETAHKLSQVLERVLAPEVIDATIDDASNGRYSADAESLGELSVPRGIGVAGAEANVLDLFFELFPFLVHLHA